MKTNLLFKQTLFCEINRGVHSIGADGDIIEACTHSIGAEGKFALIVFSLFSKGGGDIFLR